MPERSKGADLRSAGLSVRVGSNPTSGRRPSGQMDKASVSGAEDCGFESHLGCTLGFFFAQSWRRDSVMVQKLHTQR